MTKTIKISLLFIALMLPVCIFLFLKVFGTNRFDIPVYYQTNEEVIEMNCGDLVVPYVVDLNDFNAFKTASVNVIQENQITMVVYSPEDNTDLAYHVARIIDRLDENYQIVILQNDTSGKVTGKSIVKLTSNDQLGYFWKCKLLNNTTSNWVLLDSEQRIRGYYNETEKDIDRLIVEVKILLENQQYDN